jgi:molybdate/tungstate transport system substrate-binding protein
MGFSAAFGSRRSLSLLAVVALAAALVAGCGSSSKSSSKSTTAGAAASTRAAAPLGHGAVNVLYAGSLEDLMNKSIGPAFDKATGYTFTGFPAGSTDLASEIKGKVRQGDVFLSASPSVNAKLQGSANGNWVSWYAPFASTSLVIGYNPKSKFAADLKTEPWYQVITRPGFRLGFTDPKLDPKGVLAVAALDRATVAYHDPTLKSIATDSSDLFPEQDLVGRLQSGQLDAGFFYTVEASAAKIPTMSLGSIKQSAQYTITVLNRAPHQAGAKAFVRFLLGAQGTPLMRAVGLSVLPSPQATGTGVPAALGQVVKASR